MKNIRKKLTVFGLSAVIVFCLSNCGVYGTGEETEQQISTDFIESVEWVPEYSGEPYVEINANQPEFSEEEKTTSAYELYSELDSLGRCGTAEACVGEELMPDEDRGDISSVKPTGWKNEKYDSVDAEYVYNRCHLIGFQLSGENANEENLITGTRYMNTEGMLPFENQVAEYVHETENHVMYRVTPVFEGDNLVASGVHMQAESVEDGGTGVSFNVYVYNVQPYIEIDYATGDNWETDDSGIFVEGNWTETEYVINENTGKFHKPECSSVKEIKQKNKKAYTGNREELLQEGYEPCGRCKP